MRESASRSFKIDFFENVAGFCAFKDFTNSFFSLRKDKVH